MEQALIFASIIVGVAVSDQILSLHRLLRSDAPVKWHWAQPWFAMVVLLLNVMIWWSIASRDDASLTIGGFLPLLVTLILLALLTASTLPDRIDKDGIDLADYYQSNRRYQWTLLALALVWRLGSDILESVDTWAELSSLLYDRSADIVVIGVMIAMAFIRRWWLVAIGMALLSTGPIGWLSRSIG